MLLYITEYLVKFAALLIGHLLHCNVAGQGLNFIRLVVLGAGARHLVPFGHELGACRFPLKLAWGKVSLG